MLFNKEEALKLVSTVDNNLRSGWEKIALQGQTIDAMIGNAADAAVILETNKRRTSLAVKMFLPLMCVGLISFLVALQLHLSWVMVVSSVFLAASLMYCLWLVGFFQSNGVYLNAVERLKECEEALKAFTRCLTALRSHPSDGQTHLGDVITERIVNDHLIDIASMVIKAREDFNACRFDHDMTESDVAEAIEWVRACQETFSRIFITATESFGLKLDERLHRTSNEEKV